MNTQEHERYMRMALGQADRAAEEGEVPTGCVIIHAPGSDPEHRGTRIGSAHNQTELLKDPTAHAEMIAITQAAAALGDWRLNDTILYVTKEPCVMCAGAIILARIPVVVFGASDISRGGISAFGLLTQPCLNHRCDVVAGVLADECRARLQRFFRARREKHA